MAQRLTVSHIYVFTKRTVKRDLNSSQEYSARIRQFAIGRSCSPTVYVHYVHSAVNVRSTNVIPFPMDGRTEGQRYARKILYCFSTFDLSHINRAAGLLYCALRHHADTRCLFRAKIHHTVIASPEAREIARDDRTRNNIKAWLYFMSRNHSIANTRAFLTRFVGHNVI